MANYTNGKVILRQAETSIGIKTLDKYLDKLVNNYNELRYMDSDKSASMDWLGLLFSDIPECRDIRSHGIFFEGYSCENERITIFYRGCNTDGVDFFKCLCNMLGFCADVYYAWEGEYKTDQCSITFGGTKVLPSALKKIYDINVTVYGENTDSSVNCDICKSDRVRSDDYGDFYIIKIGDKYFSGYNQYRDLVLVDSFCDAFKFFNTSSGDLENMELVASLTDGELLKYSYKLYEDKQTGVFNSMDFN